MDAVDLKQIIPATIVNSRNGNQYIVEIENQDNKYYAWYESIIHNKKGPVGKRRYEVFLPKSISISDQFFEVIGLLQGEMSKTRRAQLTFCNSEPEILKRVLDWFAAEFITPIDAWRWYIKVNIPKNMLSSEDIHELTDFWLEKTGISIDKKFPTHISCIENTKNRKLANQGTLIIERQGPLFSQTIQKLVKEITLSMPSRAPEQIIQFMRGVIAAEACVNYRECTGHRRVFITATNNGERQIFRACLDVIGVESYDCYKISDIVISKRENILKLHNLGLMTLHPDKHARFLEMISSYTDTWHARRGLNAAA